MMENLKTQSPWGPIRNLLAVLFSAILVASIFALFMLYNYGPSGHYILNNVLLAPDTLANVSFADSDLTAAKSQRYQYDRIEFSNWNAEKKQWLRMPIGTSEYGQFYQKIASEKSILEVSHEVVNQFYSLPPSKLTIFMKSATANSSSGTSSKPLQVAEFSQDGNYYRIELHGQQGSEQWAYFYHPNILKEVAELFVNHLGSK